MSDEVKDQKEKSPGRRRQAEAGRANLLAYRAGRASGTNLKSGIFAVIQDGEIPLELDYAEGVRESVSELIDAAVNDLGGSEAITSTQRQILESSRLALTICALGARYLATEGLLDPRRKPHGLLNVLATYCNVVRLNAQALGLTRIARDANTLDAVLSEYAAKSPKDKENAPSD